MRVLHVTNNYPTENFPIFGIFVKEQIDSLSALGIDNNVFFINSREKGRKEYFYGYLKLIWHLSAHKYDLIHCHHSFSGAIFVATLFPLFTKCIVSFQNDPSREFNGRLFNICHLLFDKIILKNNSEFYMKYRKCIYLPNGVDVDFFTPKDKNECLKVTNLDASKKYLLFLDSHNRRTQKRIDRFEEVIKILRNKYHHFEVEPLVLTNTKRELIPYYISISAMHLLTSDFEGSPNSVKECLACNTPVVSTPVGNVVDLMGDIEGCYISRSFDPEELAQLVVLALNNPDFKGREKLIAKKLDIKSVSVKLHDLYINLTSKVNEN